jgi:hypothetical protein
MKNEGTAATIYMEIERCLCELLKLMKSQKRSMSLLGKSLYKPVSYLTCLLFLFQTLWKSSPPSVLVPI